MLSSLSLRERGMASGIQMDQETALELVKKGATLLLLDVPQFTLFGIDTQVFLQSPLLLSFPESLQYLIQNPNPKEIFEMYFLACWYHKDFVLDLDSWCVY